MFLKSFSINRLIVLLVAGGYLFLFVETLIEHQEVLPGERPAFIPIIASLIGFIISLLSLQSWKEGMISLLKYFLIVTILVGIGGLFFHNEARFQEDQDDVEAISEEIEFEGAEAPILAPSAFIGLGILGLIGTGRKRESEIRSKP
jgi:hypothetical protein